MRSFLLATTAAALVLAGCQSGPTTTEQAAAPALPAGVSLVETVKATGDEIVVPYSKYTLDNGLTVILHEDRSDPIVHVDVTYHVGSGREEIGRSGFAHFFEHMMFQGSENVGDEEHFKIVSESGGTLNGTTNGDRTNYFQTVPANQLEKMLWLEADRMGFLLPAVTQEKFEVQRATVKNERGQNYDNRPYGLIGERTSEAMFPAGHPYSWLTIGYLEDLDRATLADLKSFFLRWYGPNNAVLTIGGDLDKTQTLEWIVKYFGSIPAGPEVDDPVYQEVRLDADRYISMEDNVALPLVYMSYPTVHRFHPDEAPLDVLMSILGQGRTSLFYKNLVKPALAVQAQAGHGCRELHCEFTMLALPNPANGASLADLEQIMRDSLVEFEQRGVTDDDLTRTKMGIVSSTIFGLESVRGKVSDLAAYATFADTPNYIAQEIARYEAVTKEDVMRVYETYIKDQHAVIMSVVPEGQLATIAAPDTWTFPGRDIPEIVNAEEDDLALRVPQDDFDRSIQPPSSGENPTIKAPPTWSTSLANGVPVLAAANDETPTTAIRLRLPAGQMYEPLDKLGVAALTSRMLSEATLRSTSEELSNELDKLGSSVSFGSGDQRASMTVRALTENLEPTLAIAAEKLLEPKFDQADFDRLKGQMLQQIETQKKEAQSLASSAVNALLYGTDNAFAYTSLGTTETVSGLTLDDVKAFYAQHYAAGGAEIIAVSDLGEANLTAALSALEGLAGDAPAKPGFAAFPELAGGTLYFIDKPDAAQSQIWFAKRALPYDATGEYYRSVLMNYVLGGAFNSRINLNLREDKGYSYGAFSYFDGEEDYGAFIARAGVRSDSTAASIQEFVAEMARYQDSGLTEDDLAFTKASIGQSDARRYETPGQKLGFLGNLVTYDLDPSYVDEQAEILANATLEELNALAAKHVTLDDMIIVVVGDKASQMADIAALGYPIVELDEDGNAL